MASILQLSFRCRGIFTDDFMADLLLSVPHTGCGAVMHPDSLLISALYKLFVCVLNLLTYFPPYLFTSLFIYTYFFQKRHVLSYAGGRRRQRNLAIVFLYF